MLFCRCLGHYGYIGNQMFQYAALLGIAEKLEMEYYIDKERWCDGQFRPFLWEEFELSATDSDRPHKWGYAEPDFTYQENTEEIYPSTDLHGYFQSEKYFKNIKDKIYNEFKFKKETEEECLSYIRSISSLKDGQTVPIVGVHVRRQDYLGLPNHHPVSSLDYYSKAKEQFPDCKFVVVSDDREWCQENMGMDVFTGSTAFADMCFLSMCDHNIIANSSFSWWGAWLNSNPNKKVVAPNQWFGPAKKLNTKDLIPEGWLRV